MTTASGTGPNVHKQKLSSRSSRITDFDVKISAGNIHSHCSKMVGQNYKFNVSLCYFHDFMITILKNNLWSFKQEIPKPW